MDQLILIRLGIMKAQLRTLISTGEKAVNEDSIDSSTIEFLKSKISSYVHEIHVFMEKSTTDQAVDNIVEHTNVQLEAEDMLATLQTKCKESTASSSGLESAQTSRLPKLELIKYKGDVSRWTEFWDRFCASVHNKKLRNVDKLAYLQACVEGEAKEVICGLETTETNYDIAVATLKERFGRKTLVIDKHYAELYSLKRNSDSVSECRRIYNDIERHLRILKSLDEDTDGAHLRGLIMSKFPDDMKKQLRIRMDKDESVKTIRAHLNHIILASEETSNEPDAATEIFFTTNALYTYDETNRKRPLIGKDQNSPTKKPKLICIFCKGTHFNDKCKSIKTIEDRRQHLRNRCFLCLRPGHRVMDCKHKIMCFYCKKRHNRAICPTRESNPPIPPKDELPSPSKVSFSTKSSIVVLQTAVATLRKNENNINSMTCRLLLDCGSQRSYISSKIAKQLNLPVVEDNYLMVYTFGSNKPKEFHSPLVNINIETKTGLYLDIQVNIVNTITESVAEMQHSLLHLVPETKKNSIIMADDNTEGDKIDLLIGNNYYYSLVHNEKIRIFENLYMINTDFGWIFSGQYKQTKNDDHTLSIITYAEEITHSHLSSYITPDPPLQEDNIRKIWDLEAIGITDSIKSRRDEEAIDCFNQNIQMRNNRYYIKWPWSVCPPDLPDNLGVAYGRLRSLFKRTNDQILKLYDVTIKEQLKLGIIEEVSSPRVSKSHQIHYLPHHHVVKEGTTTTLRIVYDASARMKNESSLNQCLYKGPVLLEDLVAIILRFRRYSYGVVADVEKAFLQIGLQEDDRDVTRFLWVNDINREPSDDNTKHLRFKRVPFGIVSSPFILAATINHHLKRNNSETAKTITNNIYVDNLLTSHSTSKEVLKLHDEAIIIFQEMSMNLREWCSNCADLMVDRPEGCDKETNVLGMKWDSIEDNLRLKTDMHKLTSMVVRTKRDVLKIIASVYDPCGLIAPILLPTKLFLQDLWRRKYKWDMKLNEELKSEWNKIIAAYEEITEFKIPRSLLKNDDINFEEDTMYELHCFSDSSMQAYCAVIYLRAVNKEGTKVSLIMSKTRLKSLKEQDDLKIPKMELLGALIGCRLISYVKRALQMNIMREMLWTDSQVVISWMKTEKLLPPFVSRRVNEIKEHKNLELRYVPSKQNPADVGTRPMKGKLQDTIWISGPAFLCDETQWPFDIERTTALSAEDLPMNMEEYPTDQTMVEERQTDNQAESLNNFEKMARIESEELTKIRELQNKYFPEEYNDQNTALSRSLQLYKDEHGLLRCKGRFQNTNWHADKKFPILLPRDIDFTLEVINKIHIENYHVGVSHTLAVLREKYWVSKGRSQVQKVIHRCIQCRKYGGGPFKLPPTPALPEERVGYSPPFSYTGLDYLGPLYVNTDKGKVKRWICLYTCLAVRAIHLEVVADLTANECLMALRRFVATRGLPKMITSDNALQFKLTSEVLCNPYCIDNHIRWKFIPQLAPWYGGFYERLVGLVKHCMKRTIEKHLLSDSQLLTVIKEIEAILNTRPLTYVSADPETILKPADFLCLGGPLTLSLVDVEVHETVTETKMKLIEGWKKGQKIIKEFVEMFVNQYLPSLREKSSSRKEPRIKCHRVPKVGETIQIKDDGNRALWKVGRIKELVKSSDGQVRVVRIEVQPGGIFTRSIAHVYPLELEDLSGLDVMQDNSQQAEDLVKRTPETQVPCDNIEVSQNVEPKQLQIRDTSDTSTLETGTVSRCDRPKRLAACKARELIKLMTAQLFSVEIPSDC